MIGWLALAAGVALVALVALLAWGWFEAGWLRRRVVEVELEGIPDELDGLRIAHVSDFHLGVPGRGRHASEQAVAWVAERRPDLVCVTGDLLSRRSGLPLLERLLRELGPCLVVLGNHDLDRTRDPFSQRLDPAALTAIESVRLLTDESITIELKGLPVQIVGVDPRTYAKRDARPQELIDESIALRILLCHFPGIARRLPPGTFHLVLAGHLHAGQIVVPFPGGKLRLAHLRARDVEGIYRYGSTVLHISPGLGTTFVPFRFFARPEVTELVVRSSSWRAPR
ncbi:MAG TPA: metallophosphoesterase [Gaiellaceae bacterium]|nr:metallophosphoesterase [Gaiellaceae bacterium]